MHCLILNMLLIQVFLHMKNKPDINHIHRLLAHTATTTPKWTYTPSIKLIYNWYLIIFLLYLQLLNHVLPTQMAHVQKLVIIFAKYALKPALSSARNVGHTIKWIGRASVLSTLMVMLLLSYSHLLLPLRSVIYSMHIFY